MKYNEEYFEFADKDKLADFKQFINSVEYKKYDDMNYIEGGSGSTLLLYIPSTNGNGMVFYEYFKEFNEYRNIAVSYINASLEEQVDKIIHFINTLEYEKIYLIGYSFGGIIAQLVLRNFSAIDGVILMDTETKTEGIHPKLVKKNIKSYKRLIRSLKYLSEKRTYKSLKKSIEYDVKVGIENHQHFYEGLYTNILYSSTKEEIKSNFKKVLEFHQHYIIKKSDFNDFHSKVLFLNPNYTKGRIENEELLELFDKKEVVYYDISSRLGLVNLKISFNKIKEFLKG